MTDIHSHILYDIDDGSKSLEESIELLKALKEIGFDNIILTPHYIKGSKYETDRTKTKLLFDELEIAKKKNNIDINLYLGNEIFISDNIIKDLKNKEVYTLNNTKYFLFELPLNNQIISLTDIIYEIKLAGFIPILAHPERYTYFWNNYTEIDKLKAEGLLFQSNYGSIIGSYGPKAKKLIKYMLKKHYIDYLATDIHRIKRNTVITNYNKIVKKIKKITKEDYYNKIINNANELINKEKI